MLPLLSAILVGTSHQHAVQRVVQSPTLQQPPPTRVTESRDTPQVTLYPALAYCIAKQKIVYTSRFVRVILAQGPC